MRKIPEGAKVDAITDFSVKYFVYYIISSLSYLFGKSEKYKRLGIRFCK